MDPLEWPTRDLLTLRARATPERTAVVDADVDERYTYREFSRHVDHVASELASEGVDRIGLLLNTGPAFACTVFAAMRTQTTIIPLSVRETAAELTAKIERTEVDAIVCDSRNESVAAELVSVPTWSIRHRMDAEGFVLSSVPETSEKVPHGPGEFNSVRSDGRESVHPDGRRSVHSDGRGSVDPATLDRSWIQLIMFTSGSSGEPKAVELTLGNLVASATASAFRLGIDRDDRWLCCLPMYHMGGLAPVLRSTLYGIPVVTQRDFDAATTAQIIDTVDITGVSLVPTMLDRLLDTGWEPTERLRFVLLGGAPASDELLERSRAAGVPVFPTYGLTETASQVATATPEQVDDGIGTVGNPLVGTDVTIVTESGTPVEPGETGELVVSGPTVTPGYLDAAHSADAFCDHGLRTGDLGYRDDDGRLWIVGRCDDRIVSGGENVDPTEVQDVLETHPAVETAVVVPLPDDDWGQRVAAVLVPSDPSSPPTLQSVLSHCDKHLAGFKRPRTFAVSEELPRTVSGTLDREAIRRGLRERGIDC